FLFHRRIWNPYSYSKTPQPGLCSSNTPKESPSLSQKAGNTAPFHASLLLMSNCASEVFFGTYTAGIADNPGIWRSVFDAASGTLSTPEPAAETEQPSWLLFSPDGRLLYAANETEEFREAEGGSVTVFRLRRDGTLRRSSTVASGGVAPCHLSLSGDGHLLFATHYGGPVAVPALEAVVLVSVRCCTPV